MNTWARHPTASQTESLLKPLWDYLAPDSPTQDADVVFVFGGIDLTVPQHAANLFLDGVAAKMLITGKSGPLTEGLFSRPEAEMFAEHTMRLGVPKDSIVLEVEATNSGENVEFGMASLVRSSPAPERVVVVAKPFLLRRCVLTFAKQFPAIEVIPSCPPGPLRMFVDRPRREFALRILAELDRLRDYAQQGYIEAQPLPRSVALAQKRIEATLQVSGA